MPSRSKTTVTGQWSLVALAGPANRQGRIAADVIAGRDSRYRGTQGTAIIGLFGAAAAWTGVSEKMLNRLGDTDYEKIYLYPNSHAGYYPGAKYLAMKIIFRKSDGRLLGAQAVGQDGVDKRIDAIAMAIQMGATVYDLEEAELCYAPQFGSAKSPGQLCRDGGGRCPARRHAAEPLELPTDGAFLLDVRHPAELAVEHVPGAVNIPLPATPRAPRRAAPRPRDPRHLPLRPARLLRDAHPAAERVQRPAITSSGGHAVTLTNLRSRCLSINSHVRSELRRLDLATTLILSKEFSRIGLTARAGLACC